MLQNSLFEIPKPEVSEKLAPYKGKVIYETKGRAKEYRELACNLYQGCSHGCKYCYAPDIMHRDRPQFYKSPSPRPGVLEKLAKDAYQFGIRGEERQVLFCFACDPYQEIDEKYQLTRQAIEICHREGLNICVLTKGGLRSLRDLDLFTPKDSYAATLTTLTDEDSIKWEPGAAVPSERMEVLRHFHWRGIPTWVSLEPVLDPVWAIEIIRETKDYVDHYKVGTLNYHERAQSINWEFFAHAVKNVLEQYNKSYYLKYDLRKYL